MTERILITGGAGFIGAHLSSELLRAGHRVRVLDNLHPQVHPSCARPPYLDREVELVHGDVRDRITVAEALSGVDKVVHLAARVGVGQSMYEIQEYTDVNSVGTAVLLEALLDHPVASLVVASSMSVYGEGLYVDADGRAVAARRSRDALDAGRWEPVGPSGERLAPRPTPEHKVPALSSVYALGKYDQEQMCLMFGTAYRIPTVALRFFNVYGPYQALSNPYTGVLAIFASRLLNGRGPLVFEDGMQQRDFVSVRDVARACRLALECEAAAGHVLNVGTGRSVTISEVASILARTLDRESLTPELTGTYRVGDVRHCYADVGLARRLLGYEPAVALEDGVAELAEWLADQSADDHVEAAARELVMRGLST